MYLLFLSPLFMLQEDVVNSIKERNFRERKLSNYSHYCLWLNVWRIIIALLWLDTTKKEWKILHKSCFCKQIKTGLLQELKWNKEAHAPVYYSRPKGNSRKCKFFFLGGEGGGQGELWELCKYMVNYSAVTTLASGDKFQYILFYNFTVICFVAIFYCMTMSLDND